MSSFLKSAAAGLVIGGCLGSHCLAAELAALPKEGLILDLDATHGVVKDEAGKVTAWHNQAEKLSELAFVPRDEGREVAGSGQPTFRAAAEQPADFPTLVFRQQELICMDEDAFDHLITGTGYTWIALLKVFPQRVGVKDVNSFFGNLRNGGFYEGIWGNVDDANRVWIGSRNGRSFGRFDKNNPQVLGPTLELEKFHLIAGRMEAGTEEVEIALYVNTPEPIVTKPFPVNPKADSSLMAIGQERDAIEHPGKESFDGEIARFLIWERPLKSQELATAMEALRKTYLQPSE